MRLVDQMLWSCCILKTAKDGRMIATRNFKLDFTIKKIITIGDGFTSLHFFNEGDQLYSRMNTQENWVPFISNAAQMYQYFYDNDKTVKIQCKQTVNLNKYFT